MTDWMSPEDRLRDAMRAYTEPVEPAPDAWARMRERVDRPTTRSRRARGWQLSLAGFATAGLVIAVIGGLLVLRDEGDDGGERVATPPTTDSIGGDEREPLPNLVAVKQDGSVVVITNADGRERKIADGADQRTTLSATPDGKRVYFDRPGGVRSECGPNREIVVVTIERENLKVVARNADDPAVSPNGKRLGYVEYPGASGCFIPKTLVVEQIKNASREKWTAEGDDASIAAPSWASDSRHLGFVVVEDGGSGTYRILDTKAKSLTDARTVRLGPTSRVYGYLGDSDQLLALVPSSEATGAFQLAGLNARSGELLRVLVPLPIESALNPLSAMASPRGQNVLYVTPIGGLYVWQAVAPPPVAFTEGILAATFLPTDPER